MNTNITSVWKINMVLYSWVYSKYAEHYTVRSYHGGISHIAIQFHLVWNKIPLFLRSLWKWKPEVFQSKLIYRLLQVMVLGCFCPWLWGSLPDLLPQIYRFLERLVIITNSSCNVLMRRLYVSGGGRKSPLVPLVHTHTHICAKKN